MEVTTDSLRALAPKWSLAGDDRLLTLLQNTHQKIVTKCREVNTKLEEMTSALDVASISLQNVNNKFMALSNSQFIESRVYDDDGDVAHWEHTEEGPVAESIDELSLMKRGLTILEQAHEAAEIVDSDTDSDAQISVVLRPRDLYSHRPLPYIIGSQPWKNKWHAGLVVEDSDSDSSCPDAREGEQYSASEDDIQTHGRANDYTISETSSFSERDIPRDRDTVSRDRDTDIPKKQTPADIAAELAARLGQAPPRIHEEPEEYRHPTNKPVYRPQNPVTSTIFPDEPPPMDNDQCSSESHDDDDDDIFAEINKKQPYNNSNKDYVDDLFGKPVDGFDKDQAKSAKQKSTLFDDESEPELVADNPQKPKQTSHSSKVTERDEATVKKPVGGISLFGSNKGTESIGAAILNRNRRKSSTSGHESDDDSTVKTADKSNSSEDADKNNANAIFDNLFAKAKQAEQKTINQEKTKEKAVTPVRTSEKSKENVKDLFSDNIFDDIDDIFTSNIKVPAKDANKNAKSIFDDDDDDDLFSDIPKSNTKTTAVISNSNKKSIFDSDDELFSDVNVHNDANVTKNINVESNTVKVKESQDINRKEYNNNTTKPAKDRGSAVLDNPPPKVETKTKAKSKSIFDSDSDDDMFSNINIKINKNNKTKKINQNINTDHNTETKLIKDRKETKVVDNLKPEKAKVFQSPSLFEEDEIDDLFINANNAKIPETVKTTNIIFSETTSGHIEIQNNEVILEKKSDKKEENKSEESKEDTRNVIDNQKPVIVDTKPYIFPKIDEPETSHRSLKEDKDKNIIFVGSKKIDTELVSPENIIDTSSQDTETSKVQSKNSSMDVEIQSKILILDSVSENKTDYVSITKENEQKLCKVSEEQITDVNNELDIKVGVKRKPDTVIENNPIPAAFDDIFSEPPAFEKMKETRKSTNVNALFEDDSDDEALFFKKNDVISDEKPDLFSPSANFAIFNDEPPALDDFSSKIDDDIFSSEPNKESSTSINKPIVDDWDDNTPLPDLEQITNDNEKTKANELKNKVSSKEVLDSDDELFGNVYKTSQKDVKSGESKDSEKKIGKLNTKNFNINVQALVPGASPKKLPKEVTETNNHTKVVQSVTEVDNAESKIVKSISFEDKPDSGVLDNNLSKQRPRIQVKRRPSSRRARHEAARKSLLVDDDTDNSSSFDEPRPKPRPRTINQDKELNDKSILVQDQEILRVNPIEKTETSAIENVQNIKEDNKKEKIFIKQNELATNIIKSSFDETDTVAPMSVDITANEINEDIATSPKGDANNKLVDKTHNEKSKEANTPESTTKVVYILNDEDIFSKEKPKDNMSGKDDLFNNKETDTDVLFKNQEIIKIRSTSKETAIKPIKTQPIQTVKESSEKAQPTAKSLFDLSDDDDDELFGKSKKPVKLKTKCKLFESDSEDDLFSGKEKVKQKEKEKDIKKKDNVTEAKKVSLFGDDDDDDLFGVKTKTVLDTNKPSSSKSASKEAASSTEIVFDDPLSMLE